MTRELANKVSVIGVGNTAYGAFPEFDEYGLAARAFRAALEDCGIAKQKIDGLVVCRIPYYARMGEVLGIDPRWTLTLPPHGRMSGIGIIEAVTALAAGQCTHVALLYANIGRSRRINYGGDESPGTWDPWGMTSPGAAHALMFRRHMELFGTTTRQLAEVSVAIRHHACLNPDAVMQKPITIEDHEAARPIVLPLRLLDYCLINDGAVCLILTLSERAGDFRRKPVRIAGFGAQETYRGSSISNFDIDFWHGAVRACGEQAYAMAGVSHGDVDALMAYDNFSPTVLFSLEGLGFCKRGEAGAFVEDGALKLGGRLPTNTDGGHLSNSYMQGWALNVEAVRQLRGECGARQVADCEVVQYVQATPCSRTIIYTRDAPQRKYREGPRMTEYRKPLPRIDTLDAPFWENARARRLVVQVCDGCGDAHFPPAPVCPSCLGDTQSWREASGRGTLESWAEFHRAYWNGFKDELPYTVCLVRLEEGPLLVSNLVGNDSDARLGAKVRVVFESATSDVTLPKFMLA